MEGFEPGTLFELDLGDGDMVSFKYDPKLHSLVFIPQKIPKDQILKISYDKDLNQPMLIEKYEH